MLPEDSPGLGSVRLPVSGQPGLYVPAGYQRQATNTTHLVEPLQNSKYHLCCDLYK